MRICLLISGGLGYEILQDVQKGSMTIAAVFTDRKSSVIIDNCETLGIPCFIGNPRKGKATEFIEDLTCDLLLSVNYLFIIESDVISLPSKYAINVHGSLLPKYRGRTPHVWSIINGEEFTGITAHLIDEEMDNGAIVEQIVVPIEENDTGAMILEKYNQLYPQLIHSIFNSINNNTVELKEQDLTKATYFEKRTPADGLINWNWNKGRIRNWIRAQAKPYPGAFTFYQGKKITIHQAKFDDHGFRQSFENGQIISRGNDSMVVKTPNGCLCISEYEFDGIANVEIGKILK